MDNAVTFNLAVLVSLVPAALLPLRREGGRDGLFWGFLGLAILGPALWGVGQLGGSWRTDLSIDLWVAIASSLVVFAGTALLHRQAWRLTPVLLPYLIILGLLASLFASAPGRPISEAAPADLVTVHILIAMAIVGLLTVAASAALATFLQARALKNKRPTPFTRVLPAVSDSELLFERLLILCEIVLGLGVISGMATLYAETGRLLWSGHMTAFSLPAFLVIGLLLIGRRVCGVRGQIAARLVIVAYMFVIVGYFGVKFLDQVLLT